MAEKNSFLMYMNWAEILADPELSEEDAGALIKAICCAQLGEEYQVSNPALKVLAKSWLKKMQADADSYERKCEKNREAASKGRKEKQSENERTLTNANERYANASEREQTPANDERTQGDTDTDTDTDTGTDTGFDTGTEREKAEDPIKTIVEYLNGAAGVHYKTDTPKTVALIKARLKEGFTVDDFKTVIDKKVSNWARDGDMQKYLRPETLFGTKFEGYLNEHVKLSMREEVDSWV